MRVSIRFVFWVARATRCCPTRRKRARRARVLLAERKWCPVSPRGGVHPLGLFSPQADLPRLTVAPTVVRCLYLVPGGQGGVFQPQPDLDVPALFRPARQCVFFRLWIIRCWFGGKANLVPTLCGSNQPLGQRVVLEVDSMQRRRDQEAFCVSRDGMRRTACLVVCVYHKGGDPYT